MTGVERRDRAADTPKPPSEYLIEQGSEIHRPSQLYVSAKRNGDKIGGLRVVGHGVRVMQGSLTLP